MVKIFEIVLTQSWVGNILVVMNHHILLIFKASNPGGYFNYNKQLKQILRLQYS